MYIVCTVVNCLICWHGQVPPAWDTDAYATMTWHCRSVATILYFNAYCLPLEHFSSNHWAARICAKRRFALSDFEECEISFRGWHGFDSICVVVISEIYFQSWESIYIYIFVIVLKLTIWRRFGRADLLSLSHNTEREKGTIGAADTHVGQRVHNH